MSKPKTEEVVGAVLTFAFVVAIVAASIWWTATQWDECREMGFSTFYCLKHVL